METFVNTFDGGMDQDLSPKAIPSNKYLLGNDISLTNNGNYAGVKPRLSDENLDVLLTSDSAYGEAQDLTEVDYSGVINCLGVKGCDITMGGIKRNGLVAFITRASTIGIVNGVAFPSSTDIFEIYFYILDENNEVSLKFLVFSKTSPLNSGYLNASLDVELSGDGDTDILYFTNQVDVPMRIPCSLDVFHRDSVFYEEDLSLIRLSPAYISNVSANTGGSLLTGAYQFSVRLISESSGLKTKWSPITNPIPIFNNTDKEGTTNNVPSAGVNEASNKKITVSVDVDLESNLDYDYYQIAVIKGITGTGVSKLEAFTLSPKSKGDLSSFSFEYKGEDAENSITIDELVIDDASVENFNTLSIKNNFLIGGNVKYFDLDFDNGDIGFSSADSVVENIAVSTSLGSIGDLVGNQDNTYSMNEYNDFYYFRDEVYRFGIVYHDKYGNWSQPQIFDFSGESNNKASTGVVDWKFPSLYEEPISSDSTTQTIRGMTLEINGINNHPSWAKGFSIVRVKRIKDIKTQTPVVPTMYVQPLDSDAVYPQLGATELEEAQPPKSSLGTFMPKNLSHKRVKHCVRGNEHCQWYYGYDDEIPFQDVFDTSSGTTPSPSSHGACQYIHVIFPPENIYNNSKTYYEPYIHTPSDELEIVDIQLLKPSDAVFFPLLPGGDSNDNVNSASDLSYAARIDSSYTRVGSGNPIVTDLAYINTDNNVLEYLDITEGQDKGILTSSVPGARVTTFGDYSGLNAEGLDEGKIPSNQRCAVIVTSKPIQDVNYNLGDDPTTEETDHENEQLAIDTPNSLNKLSISDTFIPIANIRRGLSDSRYGDIDEQYEFVHTGTYVRLTDSDVSSNIAKDVLLHGGDCSYDLHTFKLSDAHYSIPDNNTYTGGIVGAPAKGAMSLFFFIKYGNSFIKTDSSDNNCELGRPIPTESYSQQISVLLESTSKARFLDRSYGQSFKIVSGQTVPAAASAADSRNPFLYQYNLDLSLPNYNKIFTKKEELNPDNNVFKSRIQYSDQRIYQSSEIGFDRFRVGNTFDLDEARGQITRLVNSQDRVYSIQSRGISYIPIQANVIESIDSSALSIRNSDVIGIPQYLTTVYGTDYFRSIADTPEGFYLADTDNRKIIRMSNNSIAEISSVGMNSYFNDKFNAYSLDTRKLFGFYDMKDKEYLLFSGERAKNTNDQWSVAYSERSGSWVSEMSSGNKFNIMSGVFAHGDSFMFGKFSHPDVRLMKLGDDSDLTYLGIEQSPYVDLYLNQNPGIPKTFDVFNVDSEFRLKSITTNTYDTNGNSVQNSLVNILDSNQREGTFRVPSLRDIATGARLRGTYAKVRLLFQEEIDSPVNNRPELFSLRNNYRISQRMY